MAEEKVRKIDDPMAILDKIAKIGKINKDVELTDQFKISMSTITAEEESFIFGYCTQFDGLEYITRHKIETLCYAIKGINGKNFIYDDISDTAERKKAREVSVNELRLKINTWREDVVTYLYDQWLQITGNSEEQLKKLGLMASAETKDALEKIKGDVEKSEKKETETK